jgi:uncharacterized protein
MTAAEIDVLVVGSGVAGLSAALEAARAGATTAVVEGESEPGGASIQSGGASCIVGTPLQARAGVADSVELAAADWRNCGGGAADLEWAIRYIERSCADVYRWCEALGIEWLGPTPAEGNSVPRLHHPIGAGRAVVERLLERLEELGVTVELNARASGLLVSDGAVGGARVETREGLHERRAGVTVVCAGGFVSDPGLLRAHVPGLEDFERVLCGGWRSARGDGLRVLRDAGAGFSELDRLWMYPVGTPNPSEDWRGLVVRGIEADEIWINRDGRRFHDESLRGGRSGIKALRACSGQTCWGVFDAGALGKLRLLDDERYGSAIASTSEQCERFFAGSSHAWAEPTLDALARGMGVPPQALAETVREYNAAVAAGVDGRFGRDLSAAAPIGEGGVCAIQYFPIAQKNLGGVVTDLHGRVLDSAGGVIRGLLAAGEVAGMAGGHINGEAALEGTMFGPSLFSGRVAGQTAAAMRSLAPAIS